MKRFLPFAVLIVAAACSDQAAPFAPTTESESVLLASRTAAGKAGKVAVCHVDDLGQYKLISINENALKAHLGHLDKLPVDGVCSVAVEPFAFGPVTLVADLENPGFSWITWTVSGTPSAVSFEIQLETPGSMGGPSTWLTQEVVLGTGASAYSSAVQWGQGTYHILATLSDGTTATSGDIVIP